MLDIDKILGITPPRQRIQLPSTDEPEVLPTTFEEWVAIHGEPEYLYETKTPSPLDIDIVDCEVEEHIDTEGVFYENKNGDLMLNYPRFVDVFAQVNKCVYSNGTFYTPDGMVSAQTIRKDIAHSLSDAGMTSRLDVPTNSLFATLKDMYSVDSLEADSTIIPVANGDLHIGKDIWEFRLGEKRQTPYRLSVNYVPTTKPTPLFDKWLSDMFAEEDIPVVQEIMGYCLVPVTSAQEAFFLVGDAGVGKSGFGTIMKALLGNAFESINTQELVTKRFQLASVENKLVAYDDDLGSAALEETGVLKKLITADTPIPAERKFGNPFSFRPYCRVVASANFMLSSLYDDSDGFYRRLHPIHVKHKDPNRKTINNFYDMIIAEEIEQIFRWALIGLKRVIENGWKISWSQRSLDYLASTKSQGTPFDDFFNEVCEVGENFDTTSAELKKAYARWCKENGIREASDMRLYRWLNDNSEKMTIVPSRTVWRGDKRVRGYKKLGIKESWKSTTF